MATTARNRHHSPLRVSGQLDSPLPGHLRLYSGRAFLHPRPQVIGSPNNDAGVDRMVNVIAHEIAELLPGQDPSSLTGIADMYREIYGTGGGGSYTGQLSVDKTGVTYNKNRGRRRFLAQGVWNLILNDCFGPNAFRQVKKVVVFFLPIHRKREREMIMEAPGNTSTSITIIS